MGIRSCYDPYSCTREQWVYGDYGQRGFLYFDGDTLTAIQN